MLFYLLLTTLSTSILIAALSLWIKTRNPGFLLGISVMYFWSIHGAWAIVYDRMGGDSGKHYHYLYEKLFPIYLDETYAWTLILYTLFILVTCATAYFYVKPPLVAERLGRNFTPLVISHERMLLLACVAGGISYLIVRGSLDEAVSDGVSGYHMTRSNHDSISLYTLHQILNRTALLPTTIGMAVFFSGPKARYIRGIALPYTFLGYLITALVLYGLCLSLGNKSELLFSLLTGALFYLFNSPKPRILMPSIIGLLALSAIAYIDFLRGIGLDSIWNELSVSEFANSLVRISSSNESYASHFSLYGSVEYEVPFTFGSSVISFVCSIIPRILWADRPEGIYQHYHDYVGAVDGQGYSIHHATAWYLNFGVIGIVMGAVLLGRIWAKLYNNLYYVSLCKYQASQLFSTLAFFTFSAGMPSLIRSGPEVYKGMIIETIIIPVFAVLFATHYVQRRRTLVRETRSRQLKQAL